MLRRWPCGGNVSPNHSRSCLLQWPRSGHSYTQLKDVISLWDYRMAQGHDFESPLVSVHVEAKKSPLLLRRDKWLFKPSWIEKRMVKWLFKYFSTLSWKENEVRVIRALRLGCSNISSCSSPTSWHYAELTQAYCLQYTYLCCCTANCWHCGTIFGKKWTIPCGNYSCHLVALWSE